jgi:hypothetical protein
VTALRQQPEGLQAQLRQLKGSQGTAASQKELRITIDATSRVLHIFFEHRFGLGCAVRLQLARAVLRIVVVFCCMIDPRCCAFGRHAAALVKAPSQRAGVITFPVMACVDADIANIKANYGTW